MPRWKIWHTRLLQGVFIAAFLAGFLIFLAHRKPPFMQLAGSTMGTTYSIKFSTDTNGAGPLDQLAIHQAIEDLLVNVNQKMSTYQPDSELSRFNLHPDNSPFHLSEDTFRVFELAQQISELTGGVFDITVGPVVNAYGFGPESRPEQMPTENELNQLRKRVGYQLIVLNPTTQTIRKTRADVYCDLSAIAKGFAVDQVAELLDKREIQNYMVEIGGEVRVRGHNADQQPWQIAIEKPITDVRSYYRIIGLGGSQQAVDLGSQSMATSGDYRNFYVLDDGSHISHTIDPRTARPVTHELASVTVIHQECARADALATAFMVLGPEEGYNLAESQGIAALFLVRQEGDAISERATSQWHNVDPVN